MTRATVGLGTWALGGRAYGPVSASESRDVLRAALAAGTQFFDCADIYGDGRAERLLGDTLPSDGCLVVTKVGYLEERGTAQRFTKAHIEAALRRSTARLRRAPDLLLLHSPPKRVIESGEALEVLDGLRDRGFVGRTGISVRGVEDVGAALEWPGCAALEVIVNLLDQRAADEGALDLARRAGADVIARVPLCFGYLSDVDPAGRIKGDDHRLRWPSQQRERWRRGARRFEFLVRDDRTLAQAAIDFCAALPGVTQVIPGARSAAQAKANASASAVGRRLSATEVERARALGPKMARETVPGAIRDPGPPA